MCSLVNPTGGYLVFAGNTNLYGIGLRQVNKVRPKMRALLPFRVAAFAKVGFAQLRAHNALSIFRRVHKAVVAHAFAKTFVGFFAANSAINITGKAQLNIFSYQLIYSYFIITQR